MNKDTLGQFFGRPLTVRSLAGHPGVPKVPPFIIDEFIDLGGKTQYEVPPSPYNLCGSCDDAVLAARLFTMPASQVGAPIYAAVIYDCLVSPTGAVITRDGGLILESLYSYTASNFMEGFSKDVEEVGGQYFLKQRGHLVELDGNTVYNRDVGEYGYFHWMNSILPRFGVISQLGDIGPKKHLVAQGTKFAQNSLRSLGISNDDIVPLHGGYHYCERLYFLSPWVIGGNHWTRPPEIRQFYTALKASLGVNGSSCESTIYLSRSDATVRRLVNEGDAINVFRQYGCKVAVTTGMSFEAQAKMFHEVKLCISVHGAGLSNLVFMQPGTAVIEIISPDRLWPTYRSLAARMGVSYTAISGVRASGEVASANVPGSLAAGNDDFSVSLEGLDYLLSVIR